MKGGVELFQNIKPVKMSVKKKKEIQGSLFRKEEFTKSIF